MLVKVALNRLDERKLEARTRWHAPSVCACAHPARPTPVRAQETERLCVFLMDQALAEMQARAA